MTQKYNVKEIGNLLKVGPKAVNAALKKAGLQEYDSSASGVGGLLKWKLTLKGMHVAERCTGVSAKGAPYDMWIWCESVVELIRPFVAAATPADASNADVLGALAKMAAAQAETNRILSALFHKVG